MFICDICLKSGILCAGCMDKLQSGKLTDLKVELSRILYSLSNRFDGLTDVSLIEVFEVNGLVILVAERGHARRLVGSGGRVVREISKRLDRSVKVVEESNEKELIGTLLFPARVQGINILYLPGGGETLKVIVSSKDVSKLPSSSDTLQAAVKELTGRDILISFE